MNILPSVTSHRPGFHWAMLGWWHSFDLDDGARLYAEFDRLGCLDGDGRLTAEATDRWFGWLDQMQYEREDGRARRLGFRSGRAALAAFWARPDRRSFGLYRQIFE